MHSHNFYMKRCLQLARLGVGKVGTNPMVGAVLVYNDTIIGEGYHKEFGKAHAEVNCLQSVADIQKNLISKSTLYVSLEPCSHYGKTAPCVDLILANNIKNVVIGCTDSFEKVNGTGIEKLNHAGVNITQQILEQECRSINKRFFTFNEKKRPYIILKWAQTNDGFIADKMSNQLKISNSLSNISIHKLRGEEAAILIGTNTALLDNPLLTNRYWFGNNPTRVIIDFECKCNHTSNFFNDEAKTIIINKIKNETLSNIKFIKIGDDFLPSLMQILIGEQINSLIVEGGSKMLQTFINAALWDEAMVITNTNLLLQNGIQAPLLSNEIHLQQKQILTDTISLYKQQQNEFL